MSREACEVDQQPHHWFRCARGTTGCPWIHDGRTPHCIACAAGECALHAQPVLEVDVADYRAGRTA